MYILYYLTKNWALNCMKVDSLDVCIPIPEDLIFVACRNGINFIKEPAQTLSFSDVERLIMSTEFYDTNFIKDEDFRRANSQMCPLDNSTPLVPFIDVSGAKIIFDQGVSLWLPIEVLENNYDFIVEYSTTYDGNNFQPTNVPLQLVEGNPYKWKGLTIDLNVIRFRIKHIPTNSYSEIIYAYPQA